MQKLFIAILFSLLWINQGLASGQIGEVKPTENSAVGRLAHLNKYIGSYNYDAILEDSYIKIQLRGMLGDDSIHLKRNFEMHAPIGLYKSYLVLMGNAPKQSENENAILCIDLISSKVTAAISSGNKIKLYSREEKYELLPVPILEWIYIINSGQRINYKPDNLMWIK